MIDRRGWCGKMCSVNATVKNLIAYLSSPEVRNVDLPRGGYVFSFDVGDAGSISNFCLRATTQVVLDTFTDAERVLAAHVPYSTESTVSGWGVRLRGRKVRPSCYNSFLTSDPEPAPDHIVE
jgi:hypothetical protein